MSEGRRLAVPTYRWVETAVRRAMIRYEEVVSLFMAACPKLVDPWLEQCIEEDLDPTDGRALDGTLVPHPLAQPQLYHYFEFNVLLPFVMQQYNSGDTSRLAVIFDLIERIFEERGYLFPRLGRSWFH